MAVDWQMFLDMKATLDTNGSWRVDQTSHKVSSELCLKCQVLHIYKRILVESECQVSGLVQMMA